MGRVSRYKKTKAFDKQHRGGEYIWGTTDLSKQKKRSKTATKLLVKKLKRKQGKHDDGGFNIPVEKDDFDLKDMVVKKVKRARLDEGLRSERLSSLPTVIPSSKPKAVVTTNKICVAGKTISVSIPEDDVAEKRAVRSLNIDLKTGQTKAERKSTVENRRPGESMTAFRQRMKVAVTKALSDNINKLKATDSAPNILDGHDEEKMSRSQKKKEYLNMKKKAKKAKSQGTLSGYDSDDYITSHKSWSQSNNEPKARLLTGEEAAAQVSFLEQAERPPVFEHLPRGAQKKSKIKTIGADNIESGIKKSIVDDEKIKAEQNALEIMRRKVQAQYALLRAKRQSQKSTF